MKLVALMFYGLVALISILVLRAFAGTAFSASGLPGFDAILIYVINPAVFLVFMSFALFWQIKFPKISFGLLGQVLLCGFLLQLSLGLHGVPNWSIGVGVIFLLVSIAFVVWGVRKLRFVSKMSG